MPSLLIHVVVTMVAMCIISQIHRADARKDSKRCATGSVASSQKDSGAVDAFGNVNSGERTSSISEHQDAYVENIAGPNSIDVLFEENVSAENSQNLWRSGMESFFDTSSSSNQIKKKSSIDKVIIQQHRQSHENYTGASLLTLFTDGLENFGIVIMHRKARKGVASISYGDACVEEMDKYQRKCVTACFGDNLERLKDHVKKEVEKLKKVTLPSDDSQSAMKKFMESTSLREKGRCQ